MTDIQCEHLKGQNCEIAERLVGSSLTTRTDRICGFCAKEDTPKTYNRVTISLAMLELRKLGRQEDASTLMRRSYRFFGRNPPQPLESSDPSFRERVSNWVKAVRNWEEAGCPTRTDEEVADILEICKPCNKYKKTVWGTICSLCGCKINEGEWAIINKARMATEKCPKKLW